MCTLFSKPLSPNSEGPCFISETSPCMVDGSMLVQRFVDELPIVSHFPTQEPLINSLQSTQELPRILQWPNRKLPIILCFPTQGLLMISQWPNQKLLIISQWPNQKPPIILR